MSTDARIVSPQQKIGARPTGPPAGAPEEPTKPAKGKKKLSVIIAAVLVVALGAAYWFLAGPGAAAPADEAAEVNAEPEYELGEVLPVEAISINLAGGHYLRLGFALQLIADAGGSHGPIDASIALDAAIALYSGRTQEELSDLDYREQLKHELEEKLFELYHEEVVAVYYTDFVTQ
ncbi:flagellar basal body-associated FliL family protein [Demequina sp. TTPB684]|uniref:flagellar basal body-associated FliL family protein n=1 Tax=unclassified Demequina TaxID=2620311 RepID=UPI001CF4DD16|nr:MULTISPECIES: flagellar basal body-associated FliL family protein [unclassified Demequina]MCB2412889.1 flagellar basal body-associated FliL family protein [Demequina sp. TTPB684]UPU87885.1 flagellar basal body-associated FliL family protein [Demequina sp. TMPB413]